MPTTTDRSATTALKTCYTCGEDIAFNLRNENTAHERLEASCGCHDWTIGEAAPSDWPYDTVQLEAAYDNIMDCR